MPFYRNIQIANECNLLLWKSTETLEELLELIELPNENQTNFKHFKNYSRKKEFLIVRILVQQALGSKVVVKNDEHGKPYLLHSNQFISITHTKSYVGILVSRHHEIALDMEEISGRIYRISQRFLSPDELSKLSGEDELLHLYQHWCAKECLIKLYGKKDVHLTNELKIHPFTPDQETFTGEVCRADFSEQYTFHHLQFDGCLLVYSCKKMQ